MTSFAPDGFHWCDANTSYDLDTAREMAPKFADLGLKALESPLPPNRIRWYQALKREWTTSRAEGRPFVNPVEPTTLRWRS